MNKITYPQALAKYRRGEPIGLCPNNLSPYAFNGAFLCTVQYEDEPSEVVATFRRLIVQFKWYNCNDSETGRGVSYYEQA